MSEESRRVFPIASSFLAFFGCARHAHVSAHHPRAAVPERASKPSFHNRDLEGSAIAKVSQLGQRVKAARKGRLTLNAAADLAGVDKSLLLKLETGQRMDVRLSTAVRLCKAFGLSLDEIAGLKPTRKR